MAILLIFWVSAIGLTVWAWNCGWERWAVLPISIGVGLMLFAAWILYDAGQFLIYIPNIIGFIFIETAVIIGLIVMILRPRKGKIGHNNKWLNLFHKSSNMKYMEGENHNAFEKPITEPVPLSQAKLKLPNGSNIMINDSIKPIGRIDLKGKVSSTVIDYVSREHFWIRSEKRKYFIEDYQSTNGTKLNGIEIKGKGLYVLQDGDKIDIAGIIVLTFSPLL